MAKSSGLARSSVLTSRNQSHGPGTLRESLRKEAFNTAPVTLLSALLSPPELIEIPLLAQSPCRGLLFAPGPQLFRGSGNSEEDSLGYVPGEEPAGAPSQSHQAFSSHCEFQSLTPIYLISRVTSDSGTAAVSSREEVGLGWGGSGDGSCGCGSEK